jgi:hypothetical protein
MCAHTIKDRVRNEIIREKVGVGSTEGKMRKNCLCWFGDIQRRPKDAPVRRIEEWRQDNLDRDRGTTKKI